MADSKEKIAVGKTIDTDFDERVMIGAISRGKAIIWTYNILIIGVLLP